MAGVVEHGETAVQAAIREVREETGLDAHGGLVALEHRYEYPVESVFVESFAIEVPWEWKPYLNEEPDAYEWWQVEGAGRGLYWEGTREAVEVLLRCLKS